MSSAAHPTTVSPCPSPDPAVTVFVDPICPFAWLAFRWLEQVERVRPVAFDVGVMSLSVLNEHRPDLPERYARLLDQGWPPARVAAVVEATYGRGRLRAFYHELGIRHHVGDRPLDTALLTEALVAAGLDAALAEAGDDPTHDALLRAHHAVPASTVGDDVGTPVLHLRAGDGTLAIFGPVLSAVPDPEVAGAMWDAVNALTAIPEFFEIKRTRDRALHLT